jgi:hypothetical protein
MTMIEAIAQVLVDLGISSAVGGSAAWAVYLSEEPAKPAKCITLYDKGGRVRAATASPAGTLVEYLDTTMIARVRAPNQEDAWEKSRKIETLHRIVGIETDDPFLTITDLLLTSSTLSAGRDAQNRHIVLTTWRVMMTRLPENGET